MRFTQLRQRHFPREWRPQVPCWLQRDYTHIDIDDVPLIERIRTKGRIDCEGLGDWRIGPSMWGESPQEAYAREQAAKSSAVQWQHMDKEAAREAQARQARRLAQEAAEKEKTLDYQKQLERRAAIEAQKKRDAVEWERRERDRLARRVANLEKAVDLQEKARKERERLVALGYQICAFCKKTLALEHFAGTGNLVPGKHVCQECAPYRGIYGYD